MLNVVRARISHAFQDLVFEEKRHLYFVKGVKYPSVSSRIEKHCVKTDFEAILPFSAAKASREEGREVTVHEMRHRWQTINKLACDLGHETHDYLEHYQGHKTPVTPQEEAGVKFLRDILVDYDIVFRELRMYSRRWKFAGTSDLLLRHKQRPEYIIADYKTNKDLWKNYRGKTLTDPFDYLEEHPYNKYQLQLSYYQLMLEEIGCPITGRMVVYLKADSTYKIYNTVDFTGELKDHLTLQKTA
jgi:hypothetical protein